MRIPRSFLYAPGDRPDRLVKALGVGADAVIADLEDAVAPDRKEAARDGVRSLLADLPAVRPQIWVRVARLSDVDVLTADVTGVVLPKATPLLLSHLEVELGRTGLDELRIAPLIETAAGVLDARLLARAPRVSHLGLGEADLGADLAVAGSAFEGPLAAVRTTVVLASAAGGITGPTGPVSTAVTDLDGLAAGTAALRAMGFASRSCIHPAQVAVVNAAFTPTAEEVDRAQALLAAFDTAGGGVLVHEGRMVDEAVVRSARRILAQA
jgi:citrate lyase subunit beta/citryl-CoA lyase